MHRIGRYIFGIISFLNPGAVTLNKHGIMRVLLPGLAGNTWAEAVLDW